MKMIKFHQIYAFYQTKMKKIAEFRGEKLFRDLKKSAPEVVMWRR
jgi:hypothetical protein